VTGRFVAPHAPWPKRGEKSDSLNEKLKAGEPTKGLGFEELALAGASFKKLVSGNLRQSQNEVQWDYTLIVQPNYTQNGQVCVPLRLVVIMALRECESKGERSIATENR